MTQDAVIEALDSPNIVTKNATWVYEKMSREIIALDSNKHGILIILGAAIIKRNIPVID